MEWIQNNLNSPLMWPMWYAIACGAIIGAEREYKQKNAGIKTTIFICIGACIFTYIGTLIEGTKDHSRIISYIVSGVGFLGGGAIIKEKNDISGLTSASIIWMTAAVGILCGLNHYFEALMASVTIVILDWSLDNLKNLFRKKQ